MCVSTYKHGFICLAETYLDSSAPDSLIDIHYKDMKDRTDIHYERYTLGHAGHPNNIKRSEVCICYKESLPVQVISLSFLKEALLLEMSYNKKGVCPCNLSLTESKQKWIWLAFI